MNVRPLACLSILMTLAPVLFPLDAPEPTGRRLRAIVAERFPGGNVFIGAASHGEGLKARPELLSILNREFSYITPANDCKQSYINTEPGKWKWELPNWWMANAASNRQVVRIHGPIGPQSSPWVLSKDRTPEDLRAFMRAFIPGVVERWNREPTVRWADVVNETWHQGKWHGPKPNPTDWQNPWLVMGMEQGADGQEYPSYIREAFELWQKALPRIKLVINQHELNTDSNDHMKALIRHLRGKGLRVDAFGWQSHIDTGWEKEAGNLDALHDMIAWCHREKLEFHITEFQAYVLSKRERPTKWNKNPVAVGPEERVARQKPQAETCAAVLKALLEHRHTGVVAVNYWHLIDSQSQDKDGNLFNDDYTPRPAYYAIQALLENPPATK